VPPTAFVPPTVVPLAPPVAALLPPVSEACPPAAELPLSEPLQPGVDSHASEMKNARMDVLLFESI